MASFFWGSKGGAMATTAATATIDLFPLSGHLNTSLGAVNANGQLVNHYQFDSYGGNEYAGQQPNSSQNSLNHQYTGEYYDADSQLTYLRARWYDAKIGRFISADPFEGKQTDPRSLNRYAYAHNDPVHVTDPTGMFGIADVGASMNVSGILANTTRHEAFSLLQDRIFGGSDVLDGPPSLYEMLLAMLMRTLSASAPGPETLGVAASALASAVSGADKHHTIPAYMCGRNSPQERVILPRPDHRVLHTQLLALDRAIRVAGVVYRVVGGRRAKGASFAPLHDVARTPYGREAIALGLAGFYETQGLRGQSWAEMGRGEFTGRRLGLVLLTEKWRFAVANHSWPRCQR